MQNSQRPHVRFGLTATRMPTLTFGTSAPTSAISPAISQPVQKGKGVLSARMPSRTKRSRGLRAHARTRTRTSLGLIVGSGTSWYASLSGPPNSLKASAFMRPGSSMSSVELLDQPWQPRVVERLRRLWLVERGAIEQPAVALGEARGDGVGGAGDGVGVEHLVGDELGHARPVALDRLAMEVGGEVLPAVGGQHRLVGARGGVERDLLLDGKALGRELGLGVADDHEAGGGVGEILATLAGGLQALVDRRLHVLAQVRGAVERMDVQPLAHLAGHAAHVLVDAGDVHGDFGMLDRPWIEERRHEVEPVELSLEIQLGPVLPAIPDRPQRQHDLAHARRRRLPLHGEPALVVPFDLRAQAQDEAATR